MSPRIDRTDRSLQLAYIDWRARHISNPVSRLRYLRTHVGEVKPGPARRRFERALPGAVMLAVTLLCLVRATSDATVRHRPASPALPGRSANAPVWLVESTPEFDLYSNGLRIEKRFEVATHPRAYVAIARENSAPARRGSEPAGIVFHATESEQLPFDPDYNRGLKRVGQSLLEYVRNRQAYNFVVDRFGRVHRIVPEGQVANHAGHSVWADEQWVYVNLNASFIGVSFEAQTTGTGEDAISPAQIHAGRTLTQMLRARYHLKGGNCVTHAQVSLSPGTMRIGYHTDWVTGFPFQEMGLADNYAEPPAALYLFGFGYDDGWSGRAGASLRDAAARAENLLRQGALGRGVTAARYRTYLRTSYREALANTRHTSIEGINHETERKRQ